LSETKSSVQNLCEEAPGAPVGRDEKRARNIRARLIATPIVLLVVCGLLYLQHASGSAIGTHLLIVLLGAAAGAEFAGLLRASGRSASPMKAAIGCGLLCAAGFAAPVGLLAAPAGLGAAMGVRVLLLVALVLWILLDHLRDTRPEAVEVMAYRFIPLLYVGLLLSFVACLAHGEHGALRLAWIVLTAKASDMAGWGVGVPFGKHKMIPSVSPGKSWEGTIGGLLASALVAAFLPGLIGLDDVAAWPLATRLAFGLLLGAASILAGVTWSGWKRRLGAKDSSALIPAMGGIMDMVDSLLLAAPAALAFFLLRGDGSLLLS